MNKEQNYHITIENMETKKKENFLLSANPDNPAKIAGVDNLAPKYQIGKMEYGDMTNHSVWAQGDWSEGGGVKYWEPYKDGYNVFPFTKKYFSKSGIRAIDYPGELRLGANAALMDNFPESDGEIAKIATRGTTVLVGVNMTDKCKIYKTVNGGNDWELIYDSSQYINHEVSSYKQNEFSVLNDMVISYADPCDDILRAQRVDPNTGTSIPTYEWDNWYQERRWGLWSGFLFINVSKPGLSWNAIIRVPIDSINEIFTEQYGSIREDKNKEYEIVGVENDFVSEYAGTVFVSLDTRRLDLGANASLFYPGQKVDIYSSGAFVSTREIVGIYQNRLVFKYNLGELTAVTVKRHPNSLVLLTDIDPPEKWYSKDFQGNNVPTHGFGFNILNKTSNKLGRCNITCGLTKGLSHRDIIAGTPIDGESYIEKTQKSTGTGNMWYYYYYAVDPETGTVSRDSHTLDPENRKYFIIDLTQANSVAADFVVGDKFKIETMAFINSSQDKILGEYSTKNPTWNTSNVKARRYRIYHNNGSLYYLKNPADALSQGYSTLWASTHYGKATAHYVDPIQRVLILGVKNINLVQSYIYEIDDTMSGTIPSLFDVGEEEVSALVKLNENIYASTNSKGRIYRWDGRSYEIMERFDLDPLTNTADLSASIVFQNKILFVDNYNGNIMSYDPEADIFDDLCAPEYLKDSSDRITSFGVVGGTLFFGTNKLGNLMWHFDETRTSSSGNLTSSWYSADMPAIDKKAIYVQILAQEFIKSDAKFRIAFQFDYSDKWYYLGKERGLGFTSEPTELNEVTFNDFKSSRALYFFFPFNTPKWKTARYRLEMFGGTYRSKTGEKRIFRPVINNVDIFYVLSDPKEILFSYPIVLEERQQTLGGQGSNEIGRHREKLDFLMDIWNNDSIVRITHIDGQIYHAIPFKPQQLAGGGMSVFYNNLNSSRKDLDKLSYLVNMMFKNINKLDNYGK